MDVGEFDHNAICGSYLNQDRMKRKFFSERRMTIYDMEYYEFSMTFHRLL